MENSLDDGEAVSDAPARACEEGEGVSPDGWDLTCCLGQVKPAFGSTGWSEER